MLLSGLIHAVGLLSYHFIFNTGLTFFALFIYSFLLPGIIFFLFTVYLTFLFIIMIHGGSFLNLLVPIGSSLLIILLGFVFLRNGFKHKEKSYGYALALLGLLTFTVGGLILNS